MKGIIQKYGMLVGIAAVIVALDQWTKILIRANLAIGETWSPAEWLAPYARLVHWNNTGAAFGFLQGFNLLFSALAVIVAAAIIYYFPRIPASEWVVRLALGLQLGGALGNLIDRIQFAQVTDFISVGNFAVFNIADSSITMGVVVLILGIWMNDVKEKKEAKLEKHDDSVIL